MYFSIIFFFFFFLAGCTHYMHRLEFFRASPVRDIYTFAFYCICIFTSVMPAAWVFCSKISPPHTLSVLSANPGACHAPCDVLLSCVIPPLGPRCNVLYILHVWQRATVLWQSSTPPFLSSLVGSTLPLLLTTKYAGLTEGEEPVGRKEEASILGLNRMPDEICYSLGALTGPA